MVSSILKLFVVSITFAATFIQIVKAYDDLPCDAIQVHNRSVICRCTTAYCDTVIREVPAKDEVITYTSSEQGLRFHKQSYSFHNKRVDADNNNVVLTLDPKTKYQTINGFGGAITDSTGSNWQNLTDPQLKQHFINSYCSDKGIQYSMLRVPIGGTDFSPERYTYNDYPKGDKDLTNFTLNPEDYKHKLPFIKACMKVATEDIHVVGSCWSPPTWMKQIESFSGTNFLKTEYYESYANYHLKFIEEYVKEGVPIWGVTTSNEPITNLAEFGIVSSIGWTVFTMGDWIADYFGPILKKKYPEVKLIGVDDQRNMIPIWLNFAAIKKPEMIDYLDGIGVHFYFNEFTGADTVTLSLKPYPKLFAISTEASFGTLQDIDVDLGSWERGALYSKNIIEDLNVGMIGWIDWNMALNSEGGPVLTGNLCDSAVIVKPEEGAFYKQPMFYSMGHFAKFMQRGSRRIKLETSNKSVNLYSVAALTPNNTIVVVLNNWETTDIEMTLKLRDKQAEITLPPSSIVTAEFAL